MEKARYNTELYSNLRVPLNNVKPSNFWGSHHFLVSLMCLGRESNPYGHFWPRDFKSRVSTYSTTKAIRVQI